MLEEMVASVMKKTLAQDFPHLKLPAAVFATIDSAAKSDAFDIEELIVHNEVTGEVFKAHITSYWYEYKLTVIDRFGNPDANYRNMRSRLRQRRGSPNSRPQYQGTLPAGRGWSQSSPD